MKASDKIYVGINPLYGLWATEEKADYPKENIEYIRKDALLKWLKERQNEALRYNGGFITGTASYQEVINKINSM